VQINPSQTILFCVSIVAYEPSKPEAGLVVLIKWVVKNSKAKIVHCFISSFQYAYLIESFISIRKLKTPLFLQIVEIIGI